MSKSEIILENLPEEILVEIFNFLHPNDLLKATQLCRKFNEIITNVQKLMRKLTLKFPRNCKESFNGTRKYSNVKVMNQHVLNIFTSFDDNKNEIKALELKKIHLEHSFIKFVNSCANLTTLNINRIQLCFSENSYYFRDMNLDVLELNCPFDKTFIALTHCRMNKLHLKNLRYKIEDSRTFINFMKTRNTLKNLTIEECEVNFFAAIDEKSFQLEHLELIDVVCEESTQSSLWNHAKAVKSMKILEISENFKFHPNFTVKFMNLEILTLTYNLVEMLNLQQFFPQLKILKIFDQNEKVFNANLRASKHNDLNLRNLVKLEYLEIKNAAISLLLLQNVKNVNLINVKFKSSFFLSSNNQIEVLKLENCRWMMDSVLEHVAESCKNLRVLKIHGGTISKRSINKTYELCKNLKCFQLIETIVTE